MFAIVLAMVVFKVNETMVMMNDKRKSKRKRGREQEGERRE